MDTELFEEWLKNHFLFYAPPAQPLLLLLDGHTLHYQLEVLRIAAAEGVIIFCLLPHAMHILQPLDNGAFGALKQHWGKACHQYCSKNPGKVVNRYNFCNVFHSAWVEVMATSLQAFGRQESTHQQGMWSYHRSLASQRIPTLTNLCHLYTSMVQYTIVR